MKFEALRAEIELVILRLMPHLRRSINSAPPVHGLTAVAIELWSFGPRTT